MPDTPVEYGSGRSYPSDMEARVAVLEEIARSTRAMLERMDQRMDRMDHRMDRMDARMAADFRWLLGVMLAGFSTMVAGFGGMLAVMAHGFHWF
ncbi:MAG: hypothetical protein ACREFY_19415 [Acetobacteraceae bacterium]